MKIKVKRYKKKTNRPDSCLKQLTLKLKTVINDKHDNHDDKQLITGYAVYKSSTD